MGSGVEANRERLPDQQGWPGSLPARRDHWIVVKKRLRPARFALHKARSGRAAGPRAGQPEGVAMTFYKFAVGVVLAVAMIAVLA